MLSIAATVMGVMMSLGHFFQAYKMNKEKSAEGVSLLAFSIFSSGSFIWLAYGISMTDWPIILSYTPGAIGATLVVTLIFKYRKNA